jgi:hypothetical protein
MTLPYNKRERLVQIVTSMQRTSRFRQRTAPAMMQRIVGSVQGTAYRTNESGGKLDP